LGKVDVAALDQYTPQDVDTGAPVVNALPVTWRKSASGAPEFGTATDPVRTDPTGTTTQPVSGPLTDAELRAQNVITTSLISQGQLRDSVTQAILIVKTAFTDPAASGDNTIVAAVASKKIQVLSYLIQASGVVNTRWKSGAATNKGPLLRWEAREGVSRVATPGAFLLETASGEALVLNLSAAIAVAVEVTYVEV
ncbi:MAG: hypothetical protein ACRDGA_12405, partial [Bacteroidota bacterium]